MSTLRRAIEIALEAHEGQTDRRGAPYILHPLQVMLSVSGLEAQIVAALHDVVEDNPQWSIERLANEGFTAVELDAVEALTKAPTEPYFDYIRRVAAVPLAKTVKLADLKDNLDLTRLGSSLTEADRARIVRYEKAKRILQGETGRDEP